jgi:hypothetical protein
MSTSQSGPRLSQARSVFGTAMVVAGVLVAIAVAVTMLALTTAYRSSARFTGPTTAHPTAAQTQLTADPGP